MDELDVTVDQFDRHLDVLSQHRVVSLDGALDALAAGDHGPHVVVTFDDGFADVHAHAFPRLADRGLPFTLYVATAYLGREMRWEGSSARPAPALSWRQLRELAASPLCTLGNHTHTHARPDRLTTDELDRCTVTLQDRLGVTPRHFAYPWGVAVPRLEDELRRRFRSAVTGQVGRNVPRTDPMRLRRVPVRQTDPIEFFAAKLRGRLLPERTYARVVTVAKGLGVHA
ncbi:MAG TPA: polysaccharide deacetylase family protein [Nitriliruptorales bacterium]|nr:polysaccharide deacetylase family protein [Nitriliruptorales bacterium]